MDLYLLTLVASVVVYDRDDAVPRVLYVRVIASHVAHFGHCLVVGDSAWCLEKGMVLKLGEYQK